MRESVNEERRGFQPLCKSYLREKLTCFYFPSCLVKERGHVPRAGDQRMTTVAVTTETEIVITTGEIDMIGIDQGLDKVK